MVKNKKDAFEERYSLKGKECKVCGAEAEVNFAYGSETLAITHGFVVPLCKKC
ncbi:MAG: hypothetical protein ACUVT7_02500 [Thermoplasmata archaeon]